MFWLVQVYVALLPGGEITQYKSRGGQHELPVSGEDFFPRTAAFAALKSEVGGQQLTIVVEQAGEFFC